MDWLAWSDVARLLAAVAGVLAAAVAGLWTLGRMFRPWMRDAARGGRRIAVRPAQGKRLQAR